MIGLVLIESIVLILQCNRQLNWIRVRTHFSRNTIICSLESNVAPKASLTSAISPPQRHGYQLVPYRDVGAASQSMDSRQPKASRRSEAVHNSFPTTDGRPILAISDVVVDGNDGETHVTSPPSRGDGGSGGWRPREGGPSRLFLFAHPRWN